MICVPDSLNSRILDERDLLCEHIGYVQVLNEISAVALSSGLNLTGSKSICLIENSGLRFACDIITRFELAHGIHNIYVLANRGIIGEENWWGVFHNEVTQDVVRRTCMKTIEVNTSTELFSALKKALKTFQTEQVSVALLLNYSIYEVSE